MPFTPFPKSAQTASNPKAKAAPVKTPAAKPMAVAPAAKTFPPAAKAAPAKKAAPKAKASPIAKVALKAAAAPAPMPAYKNGGVVKGKKGK